MPSNDLLQRFVFDGCDIRGEIIALGDSYGEVLQHNPQPAPLQQLLGQCLAAAGLLSATLKFNGTISLQARGDGPVSLLMAECSHHRQLRGIVRSNADAPPEPQTGAALPQWLGNGVMAITIEPEKGERYQGIVPLDKQNLAGCLEDYFALSEQLETRIWLAADQQIAAGLLLQKLPRQQEAGPEVNQAHWETLCALADTLTDHELLQLDQASLLYRLFHEQRLRLFDPQPLAFACSCTRERSAEALMSLGQEDVEKLLLEKGVITIDCQFCNRQYHFDTQAVRQLWGKSTLH